MLVLATAVVEGQLTNPVMAVQLVDAVELPMVARVTPEILPKKVLLQRGGLLLKLKRRASLPMRMGGIMNTSPMKPGVMLLLVMFNPDGEVPPRQPPTGLHPRTTLFSLGL